MTIARTALSTAKFVKSLINVEKKFIDTTLNANMQNVAYLITPITLVAQGDDENQRQGRSIKVASIQWSGQVTLNTSTTAWVGRFILFRDDATAGSAPTASDIMSVTTGDAAVSGYRNIYTGAAKRYEILYDSLMSLDTGDMKKKTFKHYWKINTHNHYIGTGATQSDLGNGSFYCMTIGTGTNAGATDAQLVSFVRVRFIDN